MHEERMSFIRPMRAELAEIERSIMTGNRLKGDQNALLSFLREAIDLVDKKTMPAQTHRDPIPHSEADYQATLQDANDVLGQWYQYDDIIWQGGESAQHGLNPRQAMRNTQNRSNSQVKNGKDFIQSTKRTDTPPPTTMPPRSLPMRRVPEANRPSAMLGARHTNSNESMASISSQRSMYSTSSFESQKPLSTQPVNSLGSPAMGPARPPVDRSNPRPHQRGYSSDSSSGGLINLQPGSTYGGGNGRKKAKADGSSLKDTLK